MKYIYRVWNYSDAVHCQEICFVPSFKVAINFIKAQGEINTLTDEAPSKEYWKRIFTYKEYCKQKVWEKKFSSYQEGRRYIIAHGNTYGIERIKVEA